MLCYFKLNRAEGQIIKGKERVMSHFESDSTAVKTVSETDFQDVLILCIDCEKNFVWTIGEQQFFYDKGLKNPPKRCKSCKQAKNERIAAINAAQEFGIKQKIEVIVNCAKCEAKTTVPFYPSQGRPVFCRSCFLAMNPDVLVPKE